MMKRLVLIPFVLLAGTGCEPEGPDFTEDAAVAPEALLGEFKDLPFSSSALNLVDGSAAPVKIEQPGSRSLLIRVPSTENGGESTFLLDFSCGSDCSHSRLAVTVDVPATKVDAMKILDEHKVERVFHQAVQSMIKDKEAGESVQPAAREMIDLFDALRIINNPATRQRVAAEASGESRQRPDRYAAWAQAAVRQDEAEDFRRERAMSN